MSNRYTNIPLKDVPAQVGDRNTTIYRTTKYPEIPLSVNDIYAITTSGDRLDLLAQQFYGDYTLYWIIASANPEILPLDSLFIPEGLEIRIPANVSSILFSYNQLNNI